MMTIPRNSLSPLFCCAILLFSSALFGARAIAGEDDQMFAPALDLSRDASLARSEKLVLVLEFTFEDCAFCDLLEEEFLKPMSINREYREKVIIRSVSMDGDNQIKGFFGESVSGDQLASRYRVKTSPTMVFLDADGNELSKKLVGIWSIDFFGGYIDERIDLAREKIL